MKQKNVICCNVCGGKWKSDANTLEKDFLCIHKDWGYFSEKDGQHHEIIICEECYDAWIKTMKIAPSISNTVELL